MVETQEAAANYLEIRSVAYDVLRRTFLEEPKKDFLNAFKNGYFESFPFLNENDVIKEGVNIVSSFFQNHDVDDIFEQLHWDYTRMFIGPYQLEAPLWASSYLNKDQLLFQTETMMVRQAYAKYFLEQHSIWREPDDHLGLELDFIYQLNLLLMEMTEGQAKNEIIYDQLDFLENHLLKWVPLLRVKVEENAKLEFYRGMIKILHGFLEVDKACLKDLLTESIS